MNKKRRKQLEGVAGQIEVQRVLLEELRDEEQDAFDNMPESMQQAEKGQKMEEAISSIDSALDSLEQAASDVQEGAI